MGYLDQTVRQRSNLVVLANAHVERIDTAGRKAIGVTARAVDERRSFKARETII
ncbi:MAG: hypothetical protein D4S02_13360, partial [Rhodocyclaceae bacterium]